MTPLPGHLRVLLGLLVATAAYTDWRWRRIPNWLTAGCLAAALVLQAPAFGGLGWAAAFGGLGAAAAITLPLFAIRGLGGGDVKLMAAAGAIAGPMNFVFIFLINSVLGGVAALALVLWRKRGIQTLRNIGRILSSLGKGQAPHTQSPCLGIEGDEALTLPRGVIFAVAAGLLLVTGRL